MRLRFGPAGRAVTVKTVVLMGLFGSLMTAAQLVMAPLPNIEPVSLTILLLGPVFGWQTLFAIAVFVLLEGAIFGFGLWWFAWLYVWPAGLLLSILFREMEGRLGWAVLSGFYGLAFGVLCALVYLPIGGLPLFATMAISGIPFDILHCIGNFTLMLLLGPDCRRTLRSLYQGFYVA